MIDSESVLGSLIKGYSSREDICRLVGHFWDATMKLDSLIYLDRISTDANLADDPSRNRMEEIAKRGWIITEPLDWKKFVEGLG